MAIGGIFIVSGFEKLIGPYQNFLYVIQGYSFLPLPLDEIAARFLPWVEFLLGVLLFLGLWLKWTFLGVRTLLLMFIAVVAQALIRHLPVDECGCFGGLVSLPLPVVLIFDTTVFIVLCFLSLRMPEAERCSMDGYFSQNENT